MSKISIYDKISLASTIKFTTNKPYYNFGHDNTFEFVNSISTILAKDKEVVSVAIRKMKEGNSVLYLGKNTTWTLYDKDYINDLLINIKEITKTKKITKDTEQVINIKIRIINYCKQKIQKRIKKVKNDINKMDNYIYGKNTD